MKAQKVTLLTASMDGEPIGGIQLRPPLALVVGNEGAGLSPALSQAGQPVSIPIHQGTESLNVAVAAGILLYEVTRAR
jgi:TrmH family RNA methyltransferase